MDDGSNQAGAQQFSDDQDNNAGETQAGEGETQQSQGTDEDPNKDLPQISEIDMLKQQAKLMGITHSGNIGVEALKAKIQAKLDGTKEEAPPPPVEEQEEEKEEEKEEQPKAAAKPVLNPLAGDRRGEKPAAKLTLREQVRKEALALVRCRVTNMDPKKKDLAGEIFCVGNKYTGMIRKFIPYGEATDDGYHMPKIMYDELSERRFQNIRTFKDRKTGQQRVESNWAREFSLDVLPQLTAEELATLANAQAAAGSIDKS